MSNLGDLLRKLASVLKRLIDGGVGAEDPATGGYGGLGAKPPAAGRFL